MWTVVYLAQNEDMAAKLKGMLEAGGLLAMVRSIAKSAEGDGAGFEVLVPESEVEDAHNIIIDADF